MTPSFVDVCNPNPCVNGGECTQYGDIEFMCSCNQGFTGKYCEMNSVPTGTNN